MQLLKMMSESLLLMGKMLLFSSTQKNMKKSVFTGSQGGNVRCVWGPCPVAGAAPATRLFPRSHHRGLPGTGWRLQAPRSVGRCTADAVLRLHPPNCILPSDGAASTPWNCDEDPTCLERSLPRTPESLLCTSPCIA